MAYDLNTKLNTALADHQYSLALEYSKTLLDSDSNNPNLKAIKGWCLNQVGRKKEAEVLLVEAFNQDSTQHYAAAMLISYYMERANYRQVISIGQYCVGIHSKDRLMWHRLGTAHFMSGDYEGAVIAFRRSLQVEYSKSTAFALSQPLLCQGNYEEGLELYEYRFDSFSKLNWPQSQRMPMPRWQGENLQGKSILVWTEQGLGDCIQFSRLITLLAEQGAHVDLMLPNAHGSLSELLASIKGLQAIKVITHTQVDLTRKYDFQSPMMSLLKHLNIRKNSIPVSTFPYVHLNHVANQKPRQDEWQTLINQETSTTLKVGMVWTTALKESFKKKDHLNFKQKDKKSLRTKDILPILKIEGLEFFSLHVEKSEALQDLLNKENVTDLSSRLTNFSDTALAIEALDLIISIDTSVAHLAGAVNKPVINLLPYAADWRWQSNREDTPWYPSMRLFRQVFIDDWSGLVIRIENLLEKIKKEHQTSNKINIFL